MQRPPTPSHALETPWVLGVSLEGTWPKKPPDPPSCWLVRHPPCHLAKLRPSAY